MDIALPMPRTASVNADIDVGVMGVVAASVDAIRHATGKRIHDLAFAPDKLISWARRQSWRRLMGTAFDATVDPWKNKTSNRNKTGKCAT
jgi:hypothetical protein